jgi:hypothetical protein
MFLKRDKLFKIIEKFLSREIDMRDFLCAYDEFSSEILELRSKFCSELDQLKDFQLLNIGTLELKIEANPPELVRLYDFVEEFFYDIDEREYSGVLTGISEDKIQEFYESIQKLFEKVQKSEDLSS